MPKDDKTRVITDLDIQALVDGELPKEESNRLMNLIFRSQDLIKRYNMYMHQKSLLKMWHKDN